VRGARPFQGPIDKHALVIMDFAPQSALAENGLCLCKWNRAEPLLVEMRRVSSGIRPVIKDYRRAHLKRFAFFTCFDYSLP